MFTMKFAAIVVLSFVATLAACDAGKSSGPDAAVVIDSPAGTVDAPAGVAPKYMASCSLTGTACEMPYKCYNFNSKGPHCSKTCSAAGDCPAPSTGCSNMGICKVP
jgi:hypothetical protein